MNLIDKLRLHTSLLGISALLAWGPLVQAENGATTVSVGGYQYADFLSDYSRLEALPEGGESKAAVYRNEGADWLGYRQVWLDEIEIRYELEEPPVEAEPVRGDDSELSSLQSSKGPRVTAKDLEDLKSYLHSTVSKELDGEYTLVQGPGPGVLRLRIAITELEPTKAEVSLAVTAIPFGSVADFAVGGGTGQTAYLGSATIEAEFVDSLSNDQVAAYVEKRAGNKYNIDLDDGIEAAVDEGVSSYFSAYSEWAYVKDALDYWAKALRTSLNGIPPVEPIKTVQHSRGSKALLD